ncbi:MAG: hypothetical protein WC301_05310 [Candidatus Omnitrophota bacterium]|jgi:hypothetical protein
MRKLNRNEKILATLIGIGLVAFVLKSFVLGPIYEKASRYNEEIGRANRLIRWYSALEHNRAEIIKARKQIEGYFALKGSDDAKSSAIMSKIESEARKAKVQIQDMNYTGTEKLKDKISLHRIGLRAEGQLKNMLDFFLGIEGSTILMQVEKVALSGKDEAASMLRLEAVIAGVSFE